MESYTSKMHSLTHGNISDDIYLFYRQ